MKSIITFFTVLLSIHNFLLAQPFVNQSSIILSGVSESTVDWGDYDKDGDLDILLTGRDIQNIPIAKIYKNNYPLNSFSEQTTILLTGVYNGDATWGDYDNDGDLDILILGGAATVAIAKIYRNNYPLNTFSEQSTIVFPGLYDGSVSWGDYDNDGDLDILMTGQSDSYYCKIYRNEFPNNSFIEQTNINVPGVCYGTAIWGDYDNDGDLDFLLTGKIGSQVGISKIFRNNYPQNSFTEQSNISMTGFQLCSALWGDYDNDGDLDIVLTGWINSLTSTKIYRNDYPTNTFTEQSSIVMTGNMFGSLSLGDYDNDGDLDILLTGESSKIYRNNYPANSFSEQTNISVPYAFDGSCQWGDYDNDGDLDFLVSGQDYSGPSITKLYRNTGINFNTVPSAPTGLTHSGNIFSWNESIDSQTPQNALTYNIRIGNSTNRDLIKSAMANSTNGYRRIASMGLVPNQSTLDLSFYNAGEYFWSVQSIDQSFAGSEFAPEQSFVIHTVITPLIAQNLAAGVSGNQLTVSEYQVPSSREWKFSFIPGGEYHSFTPAQTGISYTPNFQVGQTYYVVCKSTQNGIIYYSNEVQINVTPYTNAAVATNRTEFYQNVIPSTENPENLIMPGKKLRFKLRVANNYAQNLLTLKGYLRSNNAYVTILDSVGTYNNILSGQQAWTYDFYEVQISPDLPPNATIFLVLNMRDEIINTVQWNSQFSIPFLQFSNVYLDDDNFMDSQGNNDKTVQHNETIEILPLIKNTSVAKFYAVSGLLTSASPDISIWNNYPGVNTTVLNNYQFNVSLNGQINIGVTDVRPAQDYVMHYAGQSAADIGFNLKLTSYANAIQGTSWDIGGVLMKFGIPFTLVNGQSPSPEMPFINSASNAVKYNRIEFYQNVVASTENLSNLIGPGRKVRFKLLIVNFFTENLPTLKATISSTSNKVTITDSIGTLNNVDKNAQVWTADEFEIVISDDLTGIGEIEFTLTVTDQIIHAGPWTSTFKIPIMQYSMVVIDDDEIPDSYGDNDDISEPGEIVEIIPLIKNPSSKTFYGTSGQLSTTVDYLSIWNNHIGASGLVYNTYPYNMLNNIPQPITPNSNNIMPQQDFVFNHNGPGIYTLNFLLKATSFMDAYQGGSWNSGGIKMVFAIPFFLNQGQPTALINVISPNGGESWQPGTTHSILWSDNIIENVKIDLYKGGTLQQTIVASTPSTGIYSWSIPSFLISSNDYSLKITSISTNDVYDASNASFSIIPIVPASQSVQNTTVTSGQQLCYNASQTLSFAGNGSTYIMQNGSTANMIAGQKVSFLTGTKILQGAHAHAYITANGQYCNQLPQEILSLGSMSIGGNSTICFNATENLTVAGNGATFTVQSGSTVHLIAGEKINFYPNTHSASGSNLHAYISLDGVFCSNPKSAIIASDEYSTPELEKQDFFNTNDFFKVYPNPTVGKFIIEFKNDTPVNETIVEIYGLWGVKVYGENIYRDRKHEFSLSDKPSGVYFIRVISGGITETAKIIKL